MKAARLWGGGGVLLLGLGACVRAATVGVPESWSEAGVRGWTAQDLVNEKAVPGALTNADGVLTLRYGAQGMKLPPEEYLIRADAGASGGAFAGDYLGQGVTSIRFRILCEYAADVWVAFYNATSKRLWRYRVGGLTAGGWSTVEVPVDPRVLRSVNGCAEAMPAFESDLRDVAWVGVAVERHSSTRAQAYRIDDFALEGVGSEFAAWMEQFPEPGGGQSLTRNRLPGGDLDGDGADNYGEWVAGTSAGDAADKLTLAIERRAGGEGAVLRWGSRAQRTYTVERSADPSGGYTAVGEEQDAAEPQNTFEDAVEGPGPYLYRLRVRRVTP